MDQLFDPLTEVLHSLVHCVHLLVHLLHLVHDRLVLSLGALVDPVHLVQQGVGLGLDVLNGRLGVGGARGFTAGTT